MDCCGHLGTFLVIILFSLDIFTDVATGVELFLNDHPFWGSLTLVLVVSPIMVAILAEVYKCCLYEGCCGRNALDWLYLIIYPLFTVIMMALGSCHTACRREAMYLRSLEGFIAAAGQLVLNLVVLGHGVLIHSLAQWIHYLTTPDMEQRQQFESMETDIKWYWGLIQLASLVTSFLSLLQTVVYFNECEKRRFSCSRLLIALPFYTFTILYRTVAIALLTIFFKEYVMIPVAIIVVFNTVSFKLLGLDLPRSLVYGVCSLTAPVGFNRCKAPKLQPLGYVSDEVTYSERSPEQSDILRERSKRFLALHLIFGIFVLGIALVFLWLLLNYSQLYTPLSETTVLPRIFINNFLLPGIGAGAMASTVLTMVYCCTVLCCCQEEYIYPLGYSH